MYKRQVLAKLSLIVISVAMGVSIWWTVAAHDMYFDHAQKHQVGGIRRSTPDQRAIYQACRKIIIPFDPRCPRVLSYGITTGAGLGHQFTELLFGLRKAHNYGLSYVFDPFVASSSHHDNYTSINELLGLPELFEAVGNLLRSDIDQLMSDRHMDWTPLNTSLGPHVTARETCNMFYNSGGYYNCHSGPSNDCFLAPENMYLFEDAADCLRFGSRQFGKAFTECVFMGDATNKTLPGDTVYVVWHVRLGDITLHSPDDISYKTILHHLRYIAAGYKVRILLVGKGDTSGDGTSRVSSDYISALSEQARDVWNVSDVKYLPSIIAPAYTFEEAFLAMMQADVLIGSGSSMPAIASLVSGVPLYFSHVPKHGYNFGAEMTVDAVDMESNGTILESHRRLRVAVYRKLNPRQSTACRRV